MATIKGIKVGGPVTITANYGGKSATASLTVTALNLSEATISGLSNKVYTGSAIKTNPTVTISVGGTSTTLVKDTDYTVSWSSNSDSTTCKAVGTITVTVTAKSGSNYTGSKTATYQITPATISKASANNQTYNYNGTAQGVAPTFTTVGSQSYTVTYGTTEGTYNSSTVPQRTAQGTQTVFYKVTAANHNDLTGSYTLTINAIAPTLTFTAVSGTLTYNGSQQNIGTVNYNGDGTAEYVVSTSTTAPSSGWATVTNGTTIKSSAAGAGTYYVYLRSSAGTNYTAVTAKNAGNKEIGKADGSFTWTAAGTLTYNGSTQTIGTLKYTGNGTPEYAVSTSTSTPTSGWTEMSANTNVSISSSAATATTYYVHVRASAGTNYNAVDAYNIGNKAISKKAPTLTFRAKSGTITYNGSTQVIGTVSYNGDGQAQYAVSTSTTVPTTGWTNVSNGGNVTSSAATATTYYVFLKSSAGTNYSAVTSSTNAGNKAISKKAATVTAGSATKVYDGTALTKNTASLSGQVSGHTLSTYTVTGSQTTVGTSSNVPSAAVIKDGSSNTVTDNYTITYTNGTLEVTNATITVKTSGQNSVINQSYTYSGSAQGVGLVATTVNSQTATIKYGTTSGTYNLTSAPQATNVADSKTVYYQVTAPNHATVTGSYTLTINNKSISIPTPSSVTKTYTGASFSISFAAATGASITKYKYSTDGGSNWTETTTNPSRTNVGSTQVQAYYTANTNYTGSGWSSTATITVNNATITVTAPNQTYTYTGSAQGEAITVSTVNNQTATIKYGTTSGTYNLTSAPQITNVADSKTIYYQVTAPNHTTKTGSYVLTIEKAIISIPNPTGNTKTYNGSAYSATFPACTGASITNYRSDANGGSTWTEGTSNPSRTNAGTTNVQAYYTADANHSGSGWSTTAAIVINNATITVSAPAQSYTYNGSAQGVAITATTVNNQTATIKYRTSSSGTYDLTTAPQITNVSESKTIYYQVTAPNHTTKTGSYTLTITKATPTFELQGETKVFHNTAYIKARASVKGTIHWGTSQSSMGSTTSVTTASTSSFNTTVTSRGDNDGVGTTTIYAWFEPTDTGNYNSVGSSSSYSKSASAKTTKATDAQITVELSSGLSYTGASQVVATKDGGHGYAHFTLGYSTTANGTVTWGTEDATTLSLTDPGTYYIHYKFTPDANHSNEETDKLLDGTVVIGSGTLTITITGYSGTYNGSAHNIVASGPTAKNQAGTAVTGVTYTYSTSENGSYSNSLTRTDATGTSSNENATVTYWVKAVKSGYAEAKKSFTVYIGRADNPMTISPTSKTIYNTTGYNTFTITPSNAQGSVSYSSNATGKATVNSSGVVTYVAAGSATITVTAAGNTNYKSGSKTCTVTTVVDTVQTYGNISGAITISQKTEFPAKGVTLSTSNISTYFEYTSTCAQTLTWASGNTTAGTISYAWSGSNVTIASLGTNETSTTTERTISFTVTATGEGSKTKTATVTKGNQEANPVTAISLVLKNGSTNTSQVAYGSTVTTEVTATYKSTSTGIITPTTVTSSDTTIAQVLS